MSTLKIGIHLVPITCRLPEEETCCKTPIRREQRVVAVDAELLDIGPRFCRLRIPRNRYHIDPADFGVQFAWSDMVARVIWTNTTEEAIELGLLLPDTDDDL
jgi:hypothetical protein